MRRPGYREEKIDLPGGWLRGFMTTQEAMGMPGLAVSLIARGGLFGSGFSQAAQGEDKPASRAI